MNKIISIKILEEKMFKSANFDMIQNTFKEINKNNQLIKIHNIPYPL